MDKIYGLLRDVCRQQDWVTWIDERSKEDVANKEFHLGVKNTWQLERDRTIDQIANEYNDLLAACRDMVAVLESLVLHHPEWPDDVDLAALHKGQAAIARARRES